MRGRLILVTGGVRSGKSSFAERLAAQMAANPAANVDGGVNPDGDVTENTLLENGSTEVSNDSEATSSTASKGRVTYIATCIPGDDEMRQRVKIHKKRRPSHWKTIEEPLDLTGVLEKEGPMSQVVLIDCLGLYVTNLLFQEDDDMDQKGRCQDVLNCVTEFATIARNVHSHVIVVSNEVGMGLVPSYPSGRLFRDVLGWSNQALARLSDWVYFMVSGIAVSVKQ